MEAMNLSFCWQEFSKEFAKAAEAKGFCPQILADFAAGPLLVWERPGPGPRVYLSAGIHGDEPAGSLALLALLHGGFFSEQFHWLLCPALNPDGLAAARRENAQGMDLNRDYWSRSTAEVVAHAGWLMSQPSPDLCISLHEDWETSGFYFYEINLGPDVPSRAAEILSAVHPWFPAEASLEIDGHACRVPGWIYHEAEPDLPEGWPEAIYLAKLGCPLSFTFETPSCAGLGTRVAAHCAAIRAACGILSR